MGEKEIVFYCWINCSKVVPFWNTIRKRIQIITDIKLQFDPQTLLLLLFSGLPVSYNTKETLCILLLATKTAIALRYQRYQRYLRYQSVAQIFYSKENNLNQNAENGNNKNFTTSYLIL